MPKLDLILQHYKEYVTGVYQGTSDYNEEVAKHAIKSLFLELIGEPEPESSDYDLQSVIGAKNAYKVKLIVLVGQL